MHPTNPAGGKDFYAGAMRYPNSRSDRGSSIPFVRARDCEIACADLLYVSRGREVFELARVQSNTKLPFQHSYRRRDCAMVPDNLFKASGGFQVLWLRQTVRDHS